MPPQDSPTNAAPIGTGSASATNPGASRTEPAAPVITSVNPSANPRESDKIEQPLEAAGNIKKKKPDDDRKWSP